MPSRANRASSVNTYYNPGVLGGQGSSVLPYTRAQVGAAARPNPGPPGSAAGSNAVPDPRRTDYPASGAGLLPSLPRPRSRGYRGVGWGAAHGNVPDGPGSMRRPSSVPGGTPGLVGHAADDGFGLSPQRTVAHAPSVDTNRSTRWAGSQATPDPRRQWQVTGDDAGYPLPQGPYAYPKEYGTRNTSVTGVGGGGQVPAEWKQDDYHRVMPPRAGSVSTDNYRPSRRWIQTPAERPFDKNGWTYFPGGRHLLPAPLASTPLYYPHPVKDGQPSPGGWFAAPGMTPQQRMRNTVRFIPRPWDDNLADAGSGSAGAQVTQAARSRGYRGRGGQSA